MAAAAKDDDVEIAGLLGHAQESTEAVPRVTASNVLVRVVTPVAVAAMSTATWLVRCSRPVTPVENRHGVET
jgi:hypothetical protein